MRAVPSRTTPVVDAFTTLVERWVSQDAARFNAAQAATRLHHRRRELEDVNRYLASHPGVESHRGGPESRDPSQGPRTSP
jgi:hypothetical protein